MKKIFTLSGVCSLLTTFLCASDFYSTSYYPIPNFPGSEYFPVNYEAYAELLYLQPNGNDLYYGVEAIGLNPDVSIPAVSPSWQTLDINPDYHWGFEIGSKVVFPCIDNADVNVNWERLHSQDSKSFTASSAAGYTVGPLFDIGPNSENYKIATGTATYHFDEVNLNFGKGLQLFDHLQSSFYVGVSYAHIKQAMFSSYSSTDGTSYRSISTPSTYDGVGPQVGFDYNYEFPNNFFLTGSSIASFFVGNIRTGTTFQTYSPELTSLGVAQPNVQYTHVRNKTQLVPSFEQKLGLSYLWDCSPLNINLELGYRCQVYFNAVRTVDLTAPQVIPSGAVFTPEAGLFAVGFQRNPSNFILSGPYLTLNAEF